MRDKFQGRARRTPAFTIHALLITIHQPMKRCPACNRLESDDALVFCRVDGTALVSASSSLGSEAGPARLGSAAEATESAASTPPQTTAAATTRATARTTAPPAQPAPGTD